MKTSCMVAAVSVLASIGLAATGHAQTAELHPGRLTGTITFGSEVIAGGYANASSSDGYGGSSSFSGNTYSLTLEGAHDYWPYVEARIDLGGPNTYLAVRSGTAVRVPVDGVTVFDVDRPVARIAASVSVTGGRVSQVQVYGTAAENGESYSARTYVSGAGATQVEAALPMVLDSAVDLYGTAYLVTDSGRSVSFPLDRKSIGLSASGAEVSWSFDLTTLDESTGAIAGVISTDNLNGSEIVSRHYVQAYGVWNTPTQGVSGGASLVENGPYAIQSLVAGAYHTYAYSYFDAPYGYLYHPHGGNSQMTVQAGNVSTRDYAWNLAFARGAVNVTGFATRANIVGQVTAYGTYPTTSYGGHAADSFGQDGTFDIALTAGQWSLINYSLNVTDFSDPASPLRSYLWGYDRTRAAVDLAGGDEVSVASFDVDTSEAELVFDVIEAPGQPDVEISNPYLSGYAAHYDASGARVRDTGFTAYGSWAPQARPSVRIVGEPGTYTVTAAAYLNGALTQFGRFTLELKAPLDTPTGQNVAVEPAPGVSLTFDQVDAGGVTTVTESPIGPQAPEGYRVHAPYGTTLYYDISTTATFSGGVKVCIVYDDTGLSAGQENALELGHYDSATGRWDRITAEGYPDTSANVICGYTTSFSIFAVLVADDPDGDGLLGEADNCPEDPNPDQLDFDLDGAGDACDPDDDNDGVPDAADNCPLGTNDGQGDLDGDGIGDACDDDDDGDLVDDTVDNCPLDANGGQVDFDGDGAGDACDVDDDDDGVLDDADGCQQTAASALTDTAGCSSEQRLELACPVDGDYRNHGQYVRCVSHEAEAQVSIGLITEADKDRLVSEAAGSDIGKH